MDFKLSRIARNDLWDITDYYVGINPDLADRFVNEFNATLYALCINPGLGSRRYAHFFPDRSLRVWQLDRFPFLIFYREDNGFLSIIRILHERRDLSADLIAH
jgi:toxin ParE1/3/4